MKRLDARRRAPFGGSPVVGERGRKTQEKILTAALEVFAEVGYQSARIDAITERAGCSRPTFYQYFPSKADLFNRLGGLLGTSLVALTESLPDLDADRPPTDELTAWVAELVDLHADWAPAFSAFRPALRGDPLLTAGAADLTMQYGKALARSAPGGASDQGELEAALVMTMLTGAMTLRAAGQGAGPNREDTITQLTSVLHAGLTAPVMTARPGGAHREAVGSGRVTEPSPVADDDDRSVELALEAAALVVFPRLGVEGTRVDDLCAEAGVAHGTFYRYFSDKAELFERVAGRAARDMGALMAQLPAALDERQLHAWTEAWFDNYLGHGAILSVWAEAPPSEAGFSAAAAGQALDLLSPAVEADDRVGGPMSVLAVLCLLDWAPHIVQQFDGFELEPTRRAVATILDRLLAPQR